MTLPVSIDPAEGSASLSAAEARRRLRTPPSLPSRSGWRTSHDNPRTDAGLDRRGIDRRRRVAEEDRDGRLPQGLLAADGGAISVGFCLVWHRLWTRDLRRRRPRLSIDDLRASDDLRSWRPTDAAELRGGRGQGGPVLPDHGESRPANRACVPRRDDRRGGPAGRR